MQGPTVHFVQSTEIKMYPSHPRNKRHDTDVSRLKIVIRGVVQGVGFRPFIYRLATELHLPGWVSNTSQGVFLEVEGGTRNLEAFLLRIEREKPHLSYIQSLEPFWLDPVGYTGFEIRESREGGKKTTFILPDIATCPQCLEDIFDPDNRRHLYPFTNCTNCGPRFTIIKSLPYDRQNTTMARFEMCPECRREYEDPKNRRFHAQPNACPVCGPHVELWDPKGQQRSSNLYAILEAVDAIRGGKIVAVKGLGGFHLLAAAGNEDCVARLRERKHREEKPFALMYPSLAKIKEDCSVSSSEERLLCSPESPIVLLSRMNGESSKGTTIALTRLASNIAPSNPYLGVMLPYTPLHHILLRELKTPVIATSGNLSDEPLCIDEHEALRRLGSIADVFLIHNRPIVRHVDDSIVKIVLGREMVLRRARGYAPLPVTMTRSLERPTLAVGAHLKNTVAVAAGSTVIISQHIGDLETKESYDAFKRATKDVAGLYEIEKPDIVCDMHPEYLSTKYARDADRNVSEVQHHYAHIASCMAENEIDGPVCGIAWDGTGYGLDGSVWGGEFLITDETSFKRFASFRQFKLPGSDRAVKEPRRSAVGVLYEIFGESLFTSDSIAMLQSFKPAEITIIHQMLAKNVNAPITSSVGRLFDAVASIARVRQTVRFEGQAAMELEFLTSGETTEESYPYDWATSKMEPGLLLVDWKRLFLGILNDMKRSHNAAHVAKRFHNSLVQIVLDAATKADVERVVLSGGCFQNSYLTERCVRRLREQGFRPYWHQRVPPNDGGISLGQIFALARLQGVDVRHRENSVTLESGR
jgi:hydrogenase maturation protein HypF